MTDEDNGKVRTIAWSEVFPWLSLLRSFRLAIGFRVLLLAAVAMILTLGGWSLLACVFSADKSLPDLTTGGGCPWIAMERLVDERQSFLVTGTQSLATLESRPLMRPWVSLSQPLWRAFDRDLGVGGLAYLLLCGLWGLAVWALFGAMITRIVAVQVAAEERVPWASAVRHATAKWLSYFSAPLFPVIGVALAAAPVWVLGLLMRSDLGTLVAALVWPLALVAGLIMALLLLGLIFGWPLMWATISAEGTDSFDALSRSYAYVFQRPLHYLFYALVAAVVGILGWLLVWQFTAGLVAVTYWAASWGAGQARIDLIASSGPSLNILGKAGAGLIHLWIGCVKILAASYLYSYFWCAATVIYFLLRRDVDATEMDEVFLEEGGETYGLPPLKTDAAGAPEVVETDSSAPDNGAKDEE